MEERRCKEMQTVPWRFVSAGARTEIEISSQLQAWKPTGNYNICTNYNYKKDIPNAGLSKNKQLHFSTGGTLKKTPAVPSGSDCAEEHETWDGRCSLLWFHGLDHLRRPRSRQVTAGHRSLGRFGASLALKTDIKNGLVRNTTKCLPI